MGGTCWISPTKRGRMASTSSRRTCAASARPVSLPAASSVSVVIPRRRVMTYSFSAWVRYWAMRVARPTQTGSTPVACGSSVPVCPIRCIPRMRRTASTTSWEVIPAGLLTFRTPWTSGLVFIMMATIVFRRPVPAARAASVISRLTPTTPRPPPASAPWRPPARLGWYTRRHSGGRRRRRRRPVAPRPPRRESADSPAPRPPRSP